MGMTQVTTEKLYQHRPKAQGITIRRLHFNPKAIRRHYFANSPVMSHLLTALSSTFPIGEQFFVHSVRNVRDQVKDENMQIEIQIPKAVLFDVKYTVEQATNFAKKEVALGFYMQKGVSVALCSQIAGMSEKEFLVEVKDRK
jgi:hypothetical protein